MDNEAQKEQKQEIEGYAEYLDDIIERRFDMLESEIKHGISALVDVYAEIRFITHLKLMRESALDLE